MKFFSRFLFFMCFSCGVLSSAEIGESLSDIHSVLEEDDLKETPTSEKHEIQKVHRRVYYPNGGLRMVQTMTRNEEGKFIVHGVEARFFPNGKLKSRGLLTQGKRNGKWVFVSDMGYVTQGEYQEGRRSNLWKTWDSEKNLLVSEQFVDDNLHSFRRLYHLDGKISHQLFYHFGVKQGLELFWHSNGNKAKEFHWVNGMRHGEIREWSMGGKALLKGRYFMNVPDGEWKYYDEEGNLLRSSVFEDGTGVLYEYDFLKKPEGNGAKRFLKRESAYKNGKLEGKDIVYFPNGSLKSEYQYVRGKKEGKFRAWYSSGFLQAEGFFKEDMPIDVLREYYPPNPKEPMTRSILAKETTYGESMGSAMVSEFSPKGVKVSVMYLKEGVPDGDFKSFYLDGTLMRSGVFLNGLKHGLWKDFYQNGSLHSEQEYFFDKENGKYEVFYDTRLLDEEEEKPRIKIRGSFANGEKDREWKTWHLNGSLESIVMYRYGLEDGEYNEWWAKDGDLEDNREAQSRVKGNFVLGKKNGEWNIWHSNGLLKSKGFFQYGIQDGIAEEWYDYLVEGKPVLKLKGEYKNGKQDGLWESYFADGKEEMVQTYKRGKLEGEFRQSFATGALKNKAFFKDGLQEGESFEFYPNKKVKSNTMYRGGLKEGAFSFYYEEGSLKVKGSYHLNMLADLWQWFDEDGNTILASSFFENGKGTMYDFYPTGEKEMEARYESGLQEGKRITWYQSGSIRSEAIFHNGLLHGSLKEYHESGRLMTESAWVYGRKNGNYSSWYGNEQQQMSLFFVDNQPHGQSTEWYENGNMKSAGSWIQGKRDGEWKWFDRYGDGILEQIYDVGILISSSGKEEPSQN